VRVVVAHGGALSREEDADGPGRACDAAFEVLDAGGPALEAAVAGCRALEDDGRFNAGSGAVPRLDGATVEQDAACMDSAGRFGAAVGLDVRNPVLVARRVLDTPHLALAGPGAMEFARRHGLAVPRRPRPDPGRQARLLRERLARGEAPPGWTVEGLRGAWNYDAPMAVDSGSDTVGVVVSTEAGHAAAASTGGLGASLRGRVSDVGMPGGGLHAGLGGAVAATGRGEHLASRFASLRVHDAMAAGATAQDAIQAFLGATPAEAAVGIVAADGRGGAAASNRTMPWARRVG
jgi:beta-aspartyl-peptidase (threonine type)